MYVYVKTLWFVQGKMHKQIERLEDLQIAITKIGTLQQLRKEQIQAVLRCKERMEQEIVFERQLCFALERVIQNYEQTEQDILTVLEEGIRREEEIEVREMQFEEIKQQLVAFIERGGKT